MTLRLYALVVGLALALTVLTGFAPKPKVGTVGLTLTVAPDSSIHARMRVTLSGALQTPDVIRYTMYRNDTLVTDQASKVADTTFALPAPAYGQTAAYKGCARVFRGSSASGGFKCATVSYTRPEPPLPAPPEVTDVQIEPAQVSLRLGQTQQFSAKVVE